LSDSNSNPGAAAVAPPRTAREILERGRKFLEGKAVEEFRLDAELLVAHALKLNRLGLFMALERPVDESEIDLARELLVRRGHGEPVAYLTGSREFYGRPFNVGSGCLIPRPETEHIVDEARRWALERMGSSVEQRDLELEISRVAERLETSFDSAEENAPILTDSESSSAESTGEGESSGGEKELGSDWAPQILDLGTGSGCLAVTLALELEGASVRAVDVSANALRWARKNAEQFEVAIDFEESDAFESLNRLEAGSLDLVVSNPPYVDPKDADQLAREVREFEPGEALFAPKGDLDYWVRKLMQSVPKLLRANGLLLVELGADQGGRMSALAKEHAPKNSQIELIADLAGIDRVLALRITEPK
jgi:release factor glutamine methyltransferase